MAAATIKLPGFGRPIEYKPSFTFPTAVSDWVGTILTVRELNMMEMMDKITDKPDWNKKVFDDKLVRRWREEALATEDRDVSEAMLDWVCTVLLEALFDASFIYGRSLSLKLFQQRLQRTYTTQI